MKKNRWWKHWHLPLVFLIGFMLFLASHLLMHHGMVDWSLLHDIGVAFMIAAILSVTVDLAVRGQLVEDVFKASIGYILPKELKGELEWIYSSHILCAEHTQTCELHRIDNDTCTIHTNMIRKFRNISSSTEPLVIGGSLNEWCYHTGKSKIISFGYTKLGEEYEIKETVKKEGGIISIKEQEVPLVPNEEVTVWFESEEVMRTADEQIWVFGCPTMNPSVTVKVFEGLSAAVNFGYRSPAEQLGIGTHRLKGTLLPGQGITVRWWDSSKSENR